MRDLGLIIRDAPIIGSVHRYPLIGPILQYQYRLWFRRYCRYNYTHTKCHVITIFEEIFSPLKP